VLGGGAVVFGEAVYAVDVAGGDRARGGLFEGELWIAAGVGVPEFVCACAAGGLRELVAVAVVGVGGGAARGVATGGRAAGGDETHLVVEVVGVVVGVRSVPSLVAVSVVAEVGGGAIAARCRGGADLVVLVDRVRGGGRAGGVLRPVAVGVVCPAVGGG